MIPSLLTLTVGLATQLPSAASLQSQDPFLEDFQNPPNIFRPKFRYWLPDASVPTESVVRDIETIASVGAGGLEFLPFYNYGFGPITDWSVYGFGQEPFKDVLAEALNASAANGLIFDFALGANQGQGVPSETQSIGLAKELVYGTATILSGETFNGSVPAPDVNYNYLPVFIHTPESWGDNDLLAVVAARVVREDVLTSYFYSRTLAEDSLIDLTSQAADGELTWTAPSGNSTWLLFAFYERYTNQRSCDAGLNVTDPLVNGSWAVDHFSAAGAKKMTDFWDQHLLSDDRIGSLVKSAANLAWEDSMEMQFALPWTPGLLERFERVNGYSAAKYLPLFFHASNQWYEYLPPYNYTNVLDVYTADGGKYLQDYRLALGEGYVEYLQHLDLWTQGLGIAYSCQPAYNLPLEMTTAIPFVSVPELESLGFNESISAYRQFTGAAHLTGRNLISTEVGAVNSGAYSQRVPELKMLLDGSFAAGVNTLVLHGYAYQGPYVGTTWPGHTPFQFEFTEMWGPRQPAWRHLNDTLLYAARTSMVLRTGIPRVDLAFYYQENPWQLGVSAVSDHDFNAKGYTLEYLGPENLISAEAVVKDGILAPDGPAFKALVLYNQVHTSPAASAALLDFAAAGLPIYIIGTMPNTTIGTQGQEAVSANMVKLATFASVRIMPSITDFDAKALANDGITSRASVQPGSDDASTLYTFWRSDVEKKMELVYLFNRGPSDTFIISFDVPKSSNPYFLDAWTGEQVPVLAYNRDMSTGHITLEVALKQNQTKILMFESSETSGSSDGLHVSSHSDNIVNMRLDKAGNLELVISDISEASLTLSNGTTVTVPASSLEALDTPIVISPWNLTFESHGPSANNDTIEGEISVLDVGVVDEIAPWTQIPGLESLSGMGTYSATFSLAPGDLQDTAILLDFGPVLNTLRAWINGKIVRPVDPADPVIEVTELLAQGPNDIQVEVTGTLFNAIKANIDRITSQGMGPNTPSRYLDADWHEFGLVGPVELRVLRSVVVG